MSGEVDLVVVIPSRERADTICQHSLRFVPNAIVTVNQSEIEAYVAAGVPREQILPHPEMNQLCDVRNFIIDNVDHEFIFMLDDDLVTVRNSMGWRVSNIKEPRHI